QNNYNSIKNSKIFRVTLTIQTPFSQCGYISKKSFFKIIDGGTPGQAFKTTSIEEEIIDNKFSVYPNPAREVLNIEWNVIQSNEQITILVFDITGKTVFNKTFIGQKGYNKTEIDISRLSHGIYQYKFVTAIETTTGKFVKE